MFAPLKTLAKALKTPSVHEREMDYLNSAHDRVDLEFRQKEIDRGLFRARKSYPF